MGRLVVSEFVSLDGVFGDPGGGGDRNTGGCTLRCNRGADGDRFKLDELTAAEALLLGRVTYEGFAAAWRSITDEAGFAEKMNTMQKYVVPSTLETTRLEQQSHHQERCREGGTCPHGAHDGGCPGGGERPARGLADGVRPG